MSNTDVTRLPLDISRCLGRATLEPDEAPCTLRQTCRRYLAMRSDAIDAYVPVMLLTDEDGECAHYCVNNLGGQS
jgi:hypothetical protein